MKTLWIAFALLVATLAVSRIRIRIYFRKDTGKDQSYYRNFRFRMQDVIKRSIVQRTIGERRYLEKEAAFEKRTLAS